MHIMKSLKGGLGPTLLPGQQNFLFFQLSFVMNHLSTKFHSIVISYQ